MVFIYKYSISLLLYSEFDNEHKLDIVENLTVFTLKKNDWRYQSVRHQNHNDVWNFSLKLSIYKVLLNELTWQQIKSILKIVYKGLDLIDKLVIIRISNCFTKFMRRNLYNRNSMLIPGIDDKNDEMNNLCALIKCIY